MLNRVVLTAGVLAGAVLIAVLSFALGPRDAAAQIRGLAIEAAGGLAVPLSPTYNAAPELHRSLEQDGAGPSLLANRTNQAGLNTRLAVLLGSLELSYSLFNLGWRHDTIVCDTMRDGTGAYADTAYRLPDGNIDDRGVRYVCPEQRARVDTSNLGRRPLTVHNIAFGLRGVVPLSLRFSLYGAAGAGFALTNHHPDERVRRVRPGVSTHAGGGVDFEVSPQVHIAVDARYQLLLLARAGDYSLNAGRAVARDRTVLAAVLDPLHLFSATLALRLTLR